MNSILRLGGSALLVATAALWSSASPETTPSSPPPRRVENPDRVFAERLLRELDADGDGRLRPFEAADALLQLLEECPAPGLDAKALTARLAERSRDRREEAREIIDAFDRDEDGKLLIKKEVPPPWRPEISGADANADGFATAEEVAGLRFDMATMIRVEAREVFAELDRDRSGLIEAKESDAELRDFADGDGNGTIDRKELETALRSESAGASFRVENDQAVMSGVIGPTTPAEILRLLVEHPRIRRIVMTDVPGSMDDESNLRAARMIHRAGFATHLAPGATVASGGVDFFLAGRQRTMDTGARLGVHTWGGDDTTGAELPREHPSHKLYLRYYADIGIPAEFYWYTLAAAGPDDAHWMTPEEIKRYAVLTPAK